MTRYTKDGKYISFGGLNLTTPLKFCSEFQKVYNTWTIKPNLNDAILWNDMVVNMINSGVWYKLDRWFYFAIHTNDNEEALIDWINPLRYATKINNPLFTPYVGFTGDGQNCYINTNYNPINDGINYTQYSASMYACVQNNIKSKTVIGANEYPTTNLASYIYPYTDLFLNNSILIKNNSTTPLSSPSIGSRGHHFVSRDVLSTTEIKIIQNKSENIVVDSATGIPDSNFFILASPHPTLTAFEYSNYTISSAAIGGGLSKPNTDDITDIIETSLDYNNMGVIN